jgi:hypothetical protein
MYSAIHLEAVISMGKGLRAGSDSL